MVNGIDSRKGRSQILIYFVGMNFKGIEEQK